jgi:hypothetical protein
MKHTPGPWKRGSRILDIVGGKPTTLIATIACPSEHPATEAKAHANSNLISAAPEMLEALKYAAEMVKTARQYFPKSIKNRDSFMLENACATINKAIRKAEDV